MIPIIHNYSRILDQTAQNSLRETTSRYRFIFKRALNTKHDFLIDWYYWLDLRGILYYNDVCSIVYL